MRADAGVVIEIEQHRRAFRRGHQQVFELTHRMRGNHVLFVIRQVPGSKLSLLQIDVEVVQPEVRHYRLQLALAVDIGEQPGLQQFAGHQQGRV